MWGRSGRVARWPCAYLRTGGRALRGLTRRSERYNWVPGEEKISGLAGVLRRVSGVNPAQ